jgi:hypothetical protein
MQLPPFLRQVIWHLTGDERERETLRQNSCRFGSDLSEEDLLLGISSGI